MNDQDITSVCNLIAQEMKEGDMVIVNICAMHDKKRLSITNAPANIVDAILDNGFYLAVEYGAMVVTAKDEEE